MTVYFLKIREYDASIQSLIFLTPICKMHKQNMIRQTNLRKIFL